MAFVGVTRRAFAPSESEASNVRHFLAWARSASEEQRAEAAVTLAWAYRYIAHPDELHFDLELCIAALLDDPSPAVRYALAEAIAGVPDAPRHVVIALADDRPDIAAIVLGRSPALTEAELAHYAWTGEECVQAAIARRKDLPPLAAACLVEAGGVDAVMAMIANRQARLPAAVFRRAAERFGAEPTVRNAMLQRPDLPAWIRCDLIEAAAAASAALFAGSQIKPARIEKMVRSATNRSIVRAASGCSPEELRDLIRHLRKKGTLTVALLMRALASGEIAFFEQAAAELAGMDIRHVAALVRDPLGSGFAALIRRAGLPFYCIAPFAAALSALCDLRIAGCGKAVRLVVLRVIQCCEHMPAPERAALLALLRSLEKEAALDDARMFAEDARELPEERPDAGGLERSETPRCAQRLEPLNLIAMDRPPLAMAS